MNSLLQHAKAELRAAGLFDADADYDGMVAASVVSLMETFHAYGHSGGSGMMTARAFARVASYLPLTPLTGADDEWETPADKGGQIQINKRCTRVFRDADMAWDVARGRKPITFPYMPE
jgi:hypothetical protein